MYCPRQSVINLSHQSSGPIKNKKLSSENEKLMTNAICQNLFPCTTFFINSGYKYSISVNICCGFAKSNYLTCNNTEIAT